MLLAPRTPTAAGGEQQLLQQQVLAKQALLQLGCLTAILTNLPLSLLQEGELARADRTGKAECKVPLFVISKLGDVLEDAWPCKSVGPGPFELGVKKKSTVELDVAVRHAAATQACTATCMHRKGAAAAI